MRRIRQYHDANDRCLELRKAGFIDESNRILNRRRRIKGIAVFVIYWLNRVIEVIEKPVDKISFTRVHFREKYTIRKQRINRWGKDPAEQVERYRTLRLPFKLIFIKR